ncbi:MAG: hypothetical protein OEL89_05165 [Candidatus Peregrinibacteria bacterium]|nr:hypothetical protein [Candidatus Peregrinibacteria bacterium]
MNMNKNNISFQSRSACCGKKGISAIVATVLIILITVAAVTIIWAAIIPMVNTQLDKGSICLDAVSQVSLVDAGYTCKNQGNISIQIKHGAKDFNLADVQVLVSSGGSTFSYYLTDSVTTIVPADMDSTKLPSANEERVYVINTTNIAGEIDRVDIAPIIILGETQESCDVSASKVLRDC